MNKKILYVIIVILVLVLFCVRLFIFSNNNGEQKEINNNQPTTQSSSTEIVDCGLAKDPECFMNRMNSCLPVTTKMTGSDNTTVIEMTILGIESEKCHFQRKINNVLNLNCFFPKGTMNWDTIDQTFGNDKGLQKVVDEACKSGW
jgi:hypothetical protein